MDIKKLTASQLDRALNRADGAVHRIMDELIGQGRGYEKISEIRAKFDDLSLRAAAALDTANELHNEEMRRLRYHASLKRIAA